MAQHQQRNPDSQPAWTDQDRRFMLRALELARRGQGAVEPNPMVGCVLARGGRLVAEGWHQRFGGPHAEIEALRAAGAAARGSHAYVTLEPCAHHGKTPPCAEALIRAGVARVVIAHLDPFPQVRGAGAQRLKQAGVAVHVGLLADQARRLNAPYLKLVAAGRPWIIAKWAMTLDGKLASATGDSRWITSPEARQAARRIRGRVDAVLIGAGTARTDDPLLTPRPPGPRTPVRIVLDSRAALSNESQLVRSAKETPVLVAAGPDAASADQRRLEQAGCEVLQLAARDHAQRLLALLDELGRRRMTNVLVEGGARLLGQLFDLDQIDEVHVFLAPKLIGGKGAPSPVAGQGLARMAQAAQLEELRVEQLGPDLHVWGRVRRAARSEPS